METHLPPMENPLSACAVRTMVGFGEFLTLFGFVSRRFERQADVYAARTIEKNIAPVNHVGPHGAMIFASACIA